MNVQHINSGSLALEVGKKELDNAGISIEDFSREQAVALLRSALTDDVCDIDGASLELFCGRDSLLIFARLCLTSRFFLFASLEELLCAVFALAASAVSSLYKAKRGYILSLGLRPGDTLPGAVYEYGEELKMHPYERLRLREQGDELISRRAASVLQHAFSLCK